MHFSRYFYYWIFITIIVVFVVACALAGHGQPTTYFHDFSLSIFTFIAATKISCRFSYTQRLFSIMIFAWHFADSFLYFLTLFTRSSTDWRIHKIGALDVGWLVVGKNYNTEAETTQNDIDFFFFSFSRFAFTLLLWCCWSLLLLLLLSLLYGAQTWCTTIYAFFRTLAAIFPLISTIFGCIAHLFTFITCFHGCKSLLNR